MLQRGLWTAATVLAALLWFPTSSSAGLIDVIWGMSGPQMLGLISECRVDTQGEVQRCTVFGKKVAGPVLIPDRRVWLSFEGGVYFSTGRNSDGHDYEAFKTWMVAFDPIVEYRSLKCRDFFIYHGVLGLSYNFLFSPDFDSFSNVGLKLRPIGVSIHNDRVNIAYNLRIYPTRFTADQFGQPPPSTIDNTAETVHGFTVGVSW